MRSTRSAFRGAPGRTLAVIALCVLALIGAAPSAAFAWGASIYHASAASSRLCLGFNGCNNAGYGNSGYQNEYSSSHWRMYGGHNCTNYASFRLAQDGVRDFLGGGNRNADGWGAAAVRAGYAVDNANPRPGDIAWWTAATIGNDSGHVAYIESVDLDAGTMVVSEDAWGGDFDWRVYRISAPNGIIHMNKVLPPDPPTSNGGAPIVQVASALHMDVANAGIDNGTVVRLWEAVAGPAQEWVLNEDGSLRVYGNYAKCLDVTDGAIAAGAALQIWDCNGSEAQRWVAHVDGSLSVGAFCLDGSESAQHHDAALRLALCDGTPAQQWTGIPARIGTPTIAGNPAVGEILTAATGAWSPSDMQFVFQWLRDGAAVPGATQSSYALLPEDAGANVSVMVTALRAGSDPLTNASAGVEVGAAVSGAVALPLPTRVSGKDTYEANARVLEQTFQAGKPLFVVSGQSVEDALSVAPAAGVTGGAVALSNGADLSTEVWQLLAARMPSEVYLIGSEATLSVALANQLQSATGVAPVRISGKDRYETSEKIFTRFFADRAVSRAFVAGGGDVPDALIAAAAAGVLQAPVLLVDGTQGQTRLPANVLAILPYAGVKQLVVVGGTAAVPESVVANLRNSGFAVTRLAGADDIATNVAVNEYVSAQSEASEATGLWVTTDGSLPDMLTAAAAAATSPSQRLVLSNGACLPRPVVTSWLRGAGSKIREVTLVDPSGRMAADVERYTECV